MSVHSQLNIMCIDFGNIDYKKGQLPAEEKCHQGLTSEKSKNGHYSFVQVKMYC